MTTTRLGAPPAARVRERRPCADGAPQFTFAGFGLPASADPHRDLDLASCGAVAILDDNGTGRRPKESFPVLAAAHGAGE